MFLSGEITSSSSASASSSTGGSRTKTKRRLEISFTLLQTSARHGVSGRGGGVSSRCMQHLTTLLQYSEKAAITNYAPLFKESHFYSHSNYCQTSPTCLLISHNPAP